MAAGSAFVAIALVGTVAAIASGSTLAKSAAETRSAERVMASLMEEVRATDVSELVDTYDGAQRSLDGIGGSHSGTAVVDVRRIDDRTTSWAVYEVAIQVRWERSGEARVIETVAYVSDRVEGSGVAEQQLVSAESNAGSSSDPIGDLLDGISLVEDPPAEDPPGNGNGNGKGKSR